MNTGLELKKKFDKDVCPLCGIYKTCKTFTPCFEDWVKKQPCPACKKTNLIIFVWHFMLFKRVEILCENCGHETKFNT